MINRRDLILAGGAAATMAAGSGYAAPVSTGEHAASVPLDARGRVGIFTRLPDVDVESRGEFLMQLSIWNSAELYRAAEQRARAILETNGIAWNAPVSMERAVALFSSDPVLAAWAKTQSTHQSVKYRLLQTDLHRRADQYLSELDASDRVGPGSLELNTKLAIPEYCRREIHTMPGGYLGDPLAGYMYRYGVEWGVLHGRDSQDEYHNGLASAVPLPTDGRVRRVLDLGTSLGQLATSMKARFPEAEVHGIDVAAPMLRYAHMKAVGMGADVHFSQQLAESLQYPDNHFDVVTAFILFHEVRGEQTKQVLREVSRVLRPGGIFHPVDFYTAGSPPSTAMEQWTAFWNHRWNHEDWMMEYAALDFAGEMTNAGMKVQRGTVNAGLRPGPNILGVKI
jgi:ubiquinone/menaquinone biosynthesis C-methylase UbiE